MKKRGKHHRDNDSNDSSKRYDDHIARSDHRDKHSDRDKDMKPHNKPDPKPDPNPNPMEETEYREIGTGAEETFSRIVASDYEDGVSELAGADRPSPREISNEVFAQSESIPNQFGTSDFMWVWGQFIDHDIDLVEEGTVFAPIEVPDDDPFFSSIPFSRSAFAEGTGENGIPAEQINEITPLIDASMVYGSDEEREAFLRDEGGKLKVSDDNLLPFNDPDNPLANAGGDSSDLFVAGDVRANENAALTSMHTLFVREHNRWVDVLSEQNPEWNDETLYQEAKVLVEAQIQAITYEEFLPKLLGENALDEYDGFQADIDPQIANVFATAAFRLGHTMLSPTINRVDEDGNIVSEGNLQLRDAFFRPDAVQGEPGIDAIFRGLGIQEHQAIDASIVDDVRNFLFGEPGEGGLDLVSLNIQRGRDHGLSDYNSAREAYGLEKVTSFAEITSDEELQQILADLYDSVDDIDVFVGGLAEDPHGDSMLGELFHTIVAEQFTRLRDADPFWYETRLTEEQMELLEGNIQLSDVIRNNTDVEYIQQDVFTVYNRIGGSDNSNDKLVGSEENDLIIGFSGKDTLEGRDGNDELYGGKGKDTLNGGNGDDLLNGGSGKNYLTGGEGEDTFQIDAEKQKTYILDFDSEDDSIDLSALDLSTKELRDSISSKGQNTIIDLGKAGSVILVDVDANEINFYDDIIGLS